MQPLAIDVRQYGQPPGITDNLRYSLSLGLPEFVPFPMAHDGNVCIVGSGPSLAGQIGRIRKEQARKRPIVAINGAHDFLIENGITPDFFLTVDPRGMPQNLKHANDETVYLLASRVSSKDFDLLKGKKILLWHSWSTDDQMELLQGKLCVGGGTTSGLRAINFFFLCGFRNFRLYGLDSCLGKQGEKRVGGSRLDAHVNRTDVIVGGKRFLCNMAMAAQAQDFQSLYEFLPGITIKVFGGGLLAAILEARKKQGLVT